MAELPRLIVREMKGFGSVEQGQRLGIKLVDQAGVSLLLEIPFPLEADFLLSLVAAAAHAAHARAGSVDPRIRHAMVVKSIGFGPSDIGNLGIRL